MKRVKNLKWALVLSGGGAKGFAHVGVLKALSALDVPEPSLVVGTSMGAIIGGLYASGMDTAKIVDFAENRFEITDYLDSFAFRISGPVGRVLQAGQALGNLAAKPALDSGNELLVLFKNLTGDKNIEDFKIPFRCNAVDLVSGKEIVFSSGPGAVAIRASMSFPVFFAPVPLGKMLLVDGGFIDNMPVHIAREAGYSRILAVDVGGFHTRPSREFSAATKIVYRCLEIALNTLTRERRDFGPVLVIRAGNRATPLDFSRKLELIKLGETTVANEKEALEAFFGSGPGAFFARRKNSRRTGYG
jgi:NTE family protein